MGLEDVLDELVCIIPALIAKSVPISNHNGEGLVDEELDFLFVQGTDEYSPSCKSMVSELPYGQRGS